MGYLVYYRRGDRTRLIFLKLRGEVYEECYTFQLPEGIAKDTLDSYFSHVIFYLLANTLERPFIVTREFFIFKCDEKLFRVFRSLNQLVDLVYKKRRSYTDDFQIVEILQLMKYVTDVDRFIEHVENFLVAEKI